MDYALPIMTTGNPSVKTREHVAQEGDVIAVPQATRLRKDGPESCLQCVYSIQSILGNNSDVVMFYLSFESVEFQSNASA